MPDEHLGIAGIPDPLLPSWEEPYERRLFVKALRFFFPLLALSSLLAGALTSRAQGPVSPSGPDATWNIEKVAEARAFSNMGPRSLAVGPTGNPNVAYGGKHLYYAWYDGAWHIDVVDIVKQGTGASPGWEDKGLDRRVRPHMLNCQLVSAFCQRGT